MEAGFLPDTKPGTINCLALLKFQHSLSLAEGKGWGGLLFRTDNKCSRFEPKLATWSKLQVFKRQPFHYYETPGRSQTQTGKDLGIWRMVPLPPFWRCRQMYAPHKHNVLFFQSYERIKWSQLSTDKKLLLCVCILAPFISTGFVRNF